MIDKDDVEIRRHLKKFIPARLEELGMSKPELAEQTGDDFSKVCRLIRGENTPSLAFSRRLARVLKCSLDELGHNAEELASH